MGLIVCLGRSRELKPRQDHRDIWEQLAGLFWSSRALLHNTGVTEQISDGQLSGRWFEASSCEDWNSFDSHSRAVFSSCEPVSNVHVQFTLLAEHRVVREECSVHGSVFFCWNLMRVFCCSIRGKTTVVESNSILWSDPVLFRSRPWPKKNPEVY